MKWTLTLALACVSFALLAQNYGRAISTSKGFSLETEVSIVIDASEAEVWAILTNAADYPRWNSTITSMEGTIALGEKIRLKSTLDEKRTFKLKVKQIEENNILVWGDGKGTRTFMIDPREKGGVTFTMTEKIGGIMFPMYKKYLPDFMPSFEAFARDLKTEAEK